MGKQITLDDDVFFELVNKAIELNMVFCSANDVLRVILNVMLIYGFSLLV